MNATLVLRGLFIALLSVSLTALIPADAVADRDDDRQEERAKDKSEKSEKSKKSKKSKKSEKDEPELKITKANYSDKRGELSVKVKTDDLPRKSGVELFDADTGAFLKSRRVRDEKVEFTLKHAIPCAVRAESAGLSEIKAVRHAPDYCDADGLTVVLEGQATTGSTPLVNARVVSRVEGFKFVTRTDDQGFYSLTVRGLDPSSLVTLQAQGKGEQSWATLYAIAGTLGGLGPDATASLNEPTGPVAEMIASLVQLLIPAAHAEQTEIEQLTISNISTALYAILTETNGGTPPATQEEVDALFDQTNPTRVLTLAAAISLVTGPGDLPAGATSLADVVNDPVVAETLIAEVDPVDLQDAIAVISTDPDLFPPLTADSLLGLNYEAQVGNIGVNQVVSIITFNPDGTGNRENAQGDNAFNWAINTDGVLEVTFPNQEASDVLNNVPCIPIPDPVTGGDQFDPITGDLIEDCPVLVLTNYSQLAVNSTGDSRAFAVASAYTYPQGLGEDGVITDQVNFVRESGLETLTAADFEGVRLASRVGILNTQGNFSAATFINLDAGFGGTLEAARVANDQVNDIPLTWGIQNGNQLVVQYTTALGNYTNTYSFLRQLGQARQAILEIDFPDNSRSVTSAAVVETVLPGYGPGEGPGRYKLVDGPSDVSVADFVLQFNPDGTGQQQFYPLGETEGTCNEVPFNWEQVNGQLVARYASRLEFLEFINSCPPELEGVTCYIWRERTIDLLDRDADYNYIRNFQIFLNPDGSTQFGPQAYVGVQEEQGALLERCASYPDAPQPSPYAGDFSLSGDELLTTTGFFVDIAGNLQWDLVLVPFGPATYFGFIDESGFSFEPNFGFLSLTFQFSDPDNFTLTTEDLTTKQIRVYTGSRN